MSNEKWFQTQAYVESVVWVEQSSDYLSDTAVEVFCMFP